MTKIVNLRQARKTKKRADKDKAASANRAAFGRTKAEKSATAADQARAERDLAGKRREEKPGASEGETSAPDDSSS